MRFPKPSPSMVVAGLALVLASSGTTLAASHYLVTSTGQIKPSVLRSLASSARGEINEVSSPWVFSTPKIPPAWAHAKCPEGSHVISGGYTADLAPGVTVKGDHPAGNGWSVIAFDSSNPGAVTESKLKVFALCLKATP